MQGQTDTTVAIVAIVATALAGVVGPAVAGLFARARQRADHAEARRMDRLVEQRRLLYEAMDMLTSFTDTMASGRESIPRAEADALLTPFAAHQLRLWALFGRESDVARAYSKCIDAVAVLSVMMIHAEGTDAQQKIDAAQGKFIAARDQLVVVAEPYLTAR